MAEIFVVEALGQDELKYRWKVQHLTTEHNLSVFYGAWGRLLEQADGTEAPVTNQSLEFFWSDQAFTISVLYDENGTLSEFYGRALTTEPEINTVSKQITLKLAGSDLQIAPSLKYDIISSVDEKDDGTTDGDGWLDMFLMLERRDGPFDREYLIRYEELAKLG